MSTTINTADIIAVTAQGGYDVTAIYGQNDVLIWEADNEPADPALTPEWYGKSENYDFAQDYFNVLPLANGKITFELLNNNQNYILYNNTGSDNDTWSVVPLQYEGNGDTQLYLWSMSVKKLTPIYFKVTSDYVFYGYKQGDEPKIMNRIKDATCNLYVRGNMDKSFASAGKNMSFRNFFFGNTKLIGAKYLAVYRPVSGYTYENHICREMFRNCTNLLTTPELPATSLVNMCYFHMFNGCTSLTTAPELPATTLNPYCYMNMFIGCTSLTHAPSILPGTATSNCYNEMFYGCTSLTTSPVLSSTTVTTYSYRLMFKDCTNLNYIKMLLIDYNSSSLNAWVNGVAATGIFVKNINATWTNTGADGVPQGWTIIYFDPATSKYYLSDKTTECDDHGNPIAHNYANDPFTIVANESGNIDLLGGAYSHYDSVEDMDEMAWLEFEKSTDGGQTWTAVPYTPDDGNSQITLSVAAGDEIMLRCNIAALVDDPDNSGLDYITILQFNSGTTTADFAVQGNIMSLIYGSNFANQTSLTYNSSLTDRSVDFRFYNMFDSMTHLITAENLILPATTLTDNCYQNMFIGCEYLTAGPAILPATSLAQSCYEFMFSECAALTTAPVLPATILSDFCYSGMFGECESLSHITMLATDISADDCLGGWVNGVAATGTFVKAASMTSLPTGADGIPFDWTVQDAT